MSLRKKSRVEASPTQQQEDSSALHWDDLPEKCHSAILEFANANVLCALDATSKRMAALTEPFWKALARDRFGMVRATDKDRSKLSWRRGLALTQPKYVACFKLHDPPGCGCMFAGSPKMAVNGSILVRCSDDVAGENAMVIRDAQSLKFMRTRSSVCNNPWEIAICGTVGAEVIVSANLNRLVAHQGDRHQEINWEELGVKNMVSNRCGIKLLGSETHLIAIFSGKLHLFVPGVDPLLSHVSTVIVAPNVEAANLPIGCDCLAWAAGEGNPTPDKTFAFSCLPNAVSVWKLDTQASRVELVKELMDKGISERDEDELPGDAEESSGRVDSVAVSRSYLVLSPKPQAFKQIRVYDMESKKLLHCLCDHDPNDGDEDDNEEREDLIYPLQMEIIGDLLISTSTYGNALCVWQLRTGSMLRRHENAFDLRISYRMTGDGNVDVTSMVHLKHWGHPAFVTSASNSTVWIFPEDDKGKRAAECMERREQLLRPQFHADLDSDSDSDSDGDY